MVWGSGIKEQEPCLITFFLFVLALKSTYFDLPTNLKKKADKENPFIKKDAIGPFGGFVQLNFICNEPAKVFV